MDIPDSLYGPGADFELDLDGPIPLEDVQIARTQTPVSRPTMRGGVYREGESAYRMRATIRDTSVVPLLTKRMLGPSAEFAQMRVSARTKGGAYDILGSLTDSVQRPDSIVLGITIVQVDSA